MKLHFLIVDSVITYTLSIGAVRNAGRKCKAKTNFAACGQNLGEYTAKPNHRCQFRGFRRVL